MKYIFYILALIPLVTFSQNEKVLTPEMIFNNGDTVFLFGNNVKLRTEPNTSSNVTTLLPINSKITIISKTENSQEFNGMSSFWYEVKTETARGYILGGLIAIEKLSLGNTHFLITLKQKDDNYYAVTRVVRNNETAYTENDFLLNNEIFSVQAFPNKGLKNIDNIIFFNYLSEACGENGGGIYVFYSNNKLIKALDVVSISDAGVYWESEQLVFPLDEDGVTDKIVYKKEELEVVDEESKWSETKTTTAQLTWDGEKLTPDITKKPNK